MGSSNIVGQPTSFTTERTANTGFFRFFLCDSVLASRPVMMLFGCKNDWQNGCCLYKFIVTIGMVLCWFVAGRKASNDYITGEKLASPAALC